MPGYLWGEFVGDGASGQTLGGVALLVVRDDWIVKSRWLAMAQKVGGKLAELVARELPQDFPSAIPP